MTRLLRGTLSLSGFLWLFFVSIPTTLMADDPPAAEGEKKIEVEQLKKKFGSQRTSEDVVQHRHYAKTHKIDLSVFGGFFDSDPFLLTRFVGGSLGFHLNEYYSLHVLGWYHFNFASDALKALQYQARTNANTDEPRIYVGAVGRISLIYGKLNFMQLALLYYDFYFFAGVGRITTETGSYLAPTVGAGQVYYLAKNIGLKMDFYWMRYKELMREKADPATLDNPIGYRITFANALSLGLTFLF